jgi:hypothetical protein
VRRRAALALAGLAWTGLLLAAGVTVLGAVAVPSIGLSISDASRLWIATLVLWGAAALAIGGPQRLVDTLGTSAALPSTTLLVGVALVLALLATRGAVGVGGADSAGYLTQAKRWAAGTLRQPLPHDPAVPLSPWVRTPLGFRPDATETMTVPTYPPGLPLLQAGALLVGGESVAIRILPAIAIVIALLALFSVAGRASAPSRLPALAAAHSPPAFTGAGAAVATLAFASVPTVLFQALQPMSDVPALAAWLTALACSARPGRLPMLSAAAATMIGIAIRPNLAPIAVAVAWQAWHGGSPLRARARTLVVAAAAAAAVLLVAAVQWRLYGSPLQSGYGSASELFSIRHVPANLWLYPHWLRESVSTPALVLLSAGVGALAARLPFDARLRPLMATLVMVAALYLVYVPFDSWTYLRFVLLALAIGAVGLALLTEAAFARLPSRWRVPAFIVCTLAVTMPNVRLAQELGVFGVRARESRYQVAAAFVREHLPETALVLAGQHSASMTYYSELPILRADLIVPDALEQVTTRAESRAGLAIVLDVAEADEFRVRVAGASVSALDWPPRAEIGRPVTTRVWLASDRQAYRAGRPVPTARIAPPVR